MPLSPFPTFDNFLGEAHSLGNPAAIGARAARNLQPAQPQQQSAILPPAEEETILQSLYRPVLGAAGWLGGSLDKAVGGRAIRGGLDMLTGGDTSPRELLSIIPFSDTLGITDPAQQAEGRDLFTNLGAPKNIEGWHPIDQPGDALLDLAGFGAELLLDPGSYMGAGPVKFILGGGAKAATSAGKLFGKAGLAKLAPQAAEAAGRGIGRRGYLSMVAGDMADKIAKEGDPLIRQKYIQQLEAAAPNRPDLAKAVLDEIAWPDDGIFPRNPLLDEPMYGAMSYGRPKIMGGQGIDANVLGAGMDLSGNFGKYVVDPLDQIGQFIKTGNPLSRAVGQLFNNKTNEGLSQEWQELHGQTIREQQNAAAEIAPRMAGNIDEQYRASMAPEEYARRAKDRTLNQAAGGVAPGFDTYEDLGRWNEMQAELAARRAAFDPTATVPPGPADFAAHQQQRQVWEQAKALEDQAIAAEKAKQAAYEAAVSKQNIQQNTVDRNFQREMAQHAVEDAKWQAEQAPVTPQTASTPAAGVMWTNAVMKDLDLYGINPSGMSPQQGMAAIAARKAEIAANKAAIIAKADALAAEKAKPNVDLPPPSAPETLLSELPKGFHDQNYPFTQPVKFGRQGDQQIDAIKGLNAGHALYRGNQNWPDIPVEKAAQYEADLTDQIVNELGIAETYMPQANRRYAGDIGNNPHLLFSTLDKGKSAKPLLSVGPQIPKGHYRDPGGIPGGIKPAENFPALARDEVHARIRQVFGDEQASTIAPILDAFADTYARDINAVRKAGQRAATRDDFYSKHIADVRLSDFSAVSSRPIPKGIEPHGAVEPIADARRIVHAFTTASVKAGNLPSAHVLPHEFGHVFRRSLGKSNAGLLKQAESALGVADGVWTRNHEEAWARGFENYLTTGKAPTPQLESVFVKFKEWLTTVYRSIVGTPLEKQIAPELRDVFDRMLGKPAKVGLPPRAAVGAEDIARAGTLLSEQSGKNTPLKVQVLQAIQRHNPDFNPNTPMMATDLRKELDKLAGGNRQAVDDAIKELSRDDIIALQQHDHPMGIDDAQRNAFIKFPGTSNLTRLDAAYHNVLSIRSPEAQKKALELAKAVPTAQPKPPRPAAQPVVAQPPVATKMDPDLIRKFGDPASPQLDKAGLKREVNRAVVNAIQSGQKPSLVIGGNKIAIEGLEAQAGTTRELATKPIDKDLRNKYTAETLLDPVQHALDGGGKAFYVEGGKETEILGLSAGKQRKFRGPQGEILNPHNAIPEQGMRMKAKGTGGPPAPATATIRIVSGTDAKFKGADGQLYDPADVVLKGGRIELPSGQPLEYFKEEKLAAGKKAVEDAAKASAKELADLKKQQAAEAAEMGLDAPKAGKSATKTGKLEKNVGEKGTPTGLSSSINPVDELTIKEAAENEARKALAEQAEFGSKPGDVIYSEAAIAAAKAKAAQQAAAQAAKTFTAKTGGMAEKLARLKLGKTTGEELKPGLQTVAEELGEKVKTPSPAAELPAPKTVAEELATPPSKLEPPKAAITPARPRPVAPAPPVRPAPPEPPKKGPAPPSAGEPPKPPGPKQAEFPEPDDEHKLLGMKKEAADAAVAHFHEPSSAVHREQKALFDENKRLGGMGQAPEEEGGPIARNLINGNTAAAASRHTDLKHIQGQDATIHRIVSDPELKTLSEGPAKDREKAVEYVINNYGKWLPGFATVRKLRKAEKALADLDISDMADDAAEKAQLQLETAVKKAHKKLDAIVSRKAGKLVDLRYSVTQDQAEHDIFGRHITQDHQSLVRRMEDTNNFLRTAIKIGSSFDDLFKKQEPHGAEHAKTLKDVIETFRMGGKKTKDVDTRGDEFLRQVLKAKGGKWAKLKLGQTIKYAGTETTVKARLLEQRIKGDLFGDMARFKQTFLDQPDNQFRLINAVDAVTNVVKSLMLAPPRRVVRDIISSAFMAIATGNGTVSGVVDAFNFAYRNKIPKGIENSHAVKDWLRRTGKQATPENIREAIVRNAWEKNLVGPHQTTNSGNLTGFIDSDETKPVLDSVYGRKPLSLKEPWDVATKNGAWKRWVSDLFKTRGSLDMQGQSLLKPKEWTPREWKLRQETISPLVKAGEQFSAQGEFVNRMIPFLDAIQKGHTFESAADIAKKLNVDYSARNFTRFEREKMGRLAMFYKYPRKIIPMMIDEMLTHTAGGLAVTARLYGKSQSNEFTPEYLQGQLAVPVGKNEDGSQRYLTSLGLPLENLNMFHAPAGLGDIPEALKKTGLDLLGMSNPLIKAPLEQATGKQFFSDRDLRDLDPRSGRILKNLGLTDNEKLIPQPIDQLLMNSPASSILSHLGQVTDPRKSIAAKAINLSTGLRLSDVDIEKQKELQVRKLIDEELRGASGVRAYTDLYVKPEDVDKLSERDKALFRLRRSLSAKASSARKGKRPRKPKKPKAMKMRKPRRQRKRRRQTVRDTLS